MREWLRFMAVVIGWSLVGQLFLGLDIAHPIALFVVWLVGFVWLVGYVVGGGTKDADHLTLHTAGAIGIPFLFAGVIVAIDTLIN